MTVEYIKDTIRQATSPQKKEIQKDSLNDIFNFVSNYLSFDVNSIFDEFGGLYTNIFNEKIE